MPVVAEARLDIPRSTMVDRLFGVPIVQVGKLSIDASATLRTNSPGSPSQAIHDPPSSNRHDGPESEAHLKHHEMEGFEARASLVQLAHEKCSRAELVGGPHIHPIHLSVDRHARQQLDGGDAVSVDARGPKTEQELREAALTWSVTPECDLEQVAIIQFLDPSERDAEAGRQDDREGGVQAVHLGDGITHVVCEAKAA